MTRLAFTTAFLLLTTTCAQGQEPPTGPTTQPQTRWRGIRVTAESARAGFERPDWDVRDTEIHRRDGSPPCTPYTRTPIAYVGPGDGLDREHIVALAEAWDSRPAGFDTSTLRAVAEGPRQPDTRRRGSEPEQERPRRRAMAGSVVV